MSDYEKAREFILDVLDEAGANGINIADIFDRIKEHRIDRALANTAFNDLYDEGLMKYCRTYLDDSNFYAYQWEWFINNRGAAKKVMKNACFYYGENLADRIAMHVRYIGLKDDDLRAVLECINKGTEEKRNELESGLIDVGKWGKIY